MNNNGRKKEETEMFILGAVVILLGVYLVYALVHPDRF